MQKKCQDEQNIKILNKDQVSDTTMPSHLKVWGKRTNQEYGSCLFFFNFDILFIMIFCIDFYVFKYYIIMLFILIIEVWGDSFSLI